MLDRDAILKAKDSQVEEVPVPEWGGSVFLRAITGNERDRYERMVIEQKLPSRAALLVMCICDKDGNRTFTDADVQTLGSKSGAVLERLFDKATAMSGIGLGGLEEAVKNLLSAQNGSSGSD